MYTAAQESDMLIYLDCDFTYPADMIPVVRRIIEEEGVDVVNCARTRTRPAAMPVPNFLANRAFAAMAHAMHGVPTCDVHSGMRGYRSGAIRAFDFDGEGDAVPIDTLLWPAKCGYHVVELPIDYNERVGGLQAPQAGRDGVDDDPAGEDAARGAKARGAVRGPVAPRGAPRRQRAGCWASHCAASAAPSRLPWRP